MAVRLAVTMVMARYLGKALFGDRSYVMALVGSFEILANFGLNQIAVREIAVHRDKADVYFGSVILLKALMTVVTLGVLVVIAQTSPGGAHVRSGIYLYGLAAILNFFANTYYVLYRAFERMQYEAVLVIVERGLFLLLALLLVYLKAGFVALFWANLIAALVKLAVGAWLTVSRFTLPKIRFDWTLYKTYVRETLPVGISQLINTMSVRIDIVLLGYLATSEIVGTFSGPYRIVDAVGLLSVVLVTSLFPVMSRRASVGVEALRDLLQRAVKVTLLVALPASIGLFLLARPALNLALGEQFADSQAVLMVLTVVIAPIYLTRLFHFCFIALKHQVEYTYIGGGTLLLNAVLDLILIPRIGYWGACVGALTAALVRLLICSWRLRRHVGPVYPWKTLWRLLLPNLALAAVLWALPTWMSNWSWSWILAGAAAGLVYLALAWFAGALDQSEKGAMRLVLAKIGTRSR